MKKRKQEFKPRKDFSDSDENESKQKLSVVDICEGEKINKEGSSEKDMHENSEEHRSKQLIDPNESLPSTVVDDDNLQPLENHDVMVESFEPFENTNVWNEHSYSVNPHGNEDQPSTSQGILIQQQYDSIFDEIDDVYTQGLSD